ncbi:MULTISPECIES: ADP-ribosylglycohydrolase family protein [unclassified Leptolyngbya]|uniref:ADP-ribosylglycohydrolase family protein n=1 Tax=unclassified Leptolyngbya TaxID=2650499 RepID=UPI0016896F31|nr:MULTISPECIES: ADP-ribosylglycohydrolase family protein [unclassified Leptolyngbya]MBD1913389.1 ADP-ribosylglycohydrolase family protein [Leptolyngbya sp. FACHB-8]MBD2158680.1 ADP-ribosylglycohydrolase family protein [Leptolyngbya sp. FACHB-16]
MSHPNSASQSLDAAYNSLVGLAVGDAFGDQFFRLLAQYESPAENRILPPRPWSWTDDTNMALSIYSVLRQDGHIEPNRLAQDFLERYNPSRDYGPALNRLLRETACGADLVQAAKTQFGGQGSYGNGAAMRVAPLGAFFSADLSAVVEQARASALTTHTHPEAVAGAIAVAVAAAYATQLCGSPPPIPREFLTLVLPLIPPSEVASKVARACEFEPGMSVYRVAAKLGSGSKISAQDTVPYTLWCASQQLGNYEEALWLTVKGLGDVDTTCAIVGGIVACYTGQAEIPMEWKNACEPLPSWID